MAVHQQNPTISWSAKNLNEEWKRFEQLAKLMFQGPLKQAKEEEQSAYLLIWIGATGRDIFNSWGLSDEDSKNPVVLMAKFKEYFAPKKNTVFARYIFQEKRQQQGEAFDTFVTDLRNLVKDCSYTNAEEMVRDRIVAGINSQDIREKLLTEGDTLTMEKAIEIAVTYETTQQHLQSMASRGAAGNVDAVRHYGHHRPRQPHKQSQSRGETKDCRNCGGKHGRKECPAFGQTCHYCHKRNHWASVCQAKKPPKDRPGKKNVHTLAEDEEDDPPFFICAIDGANDFPDTAYADVSINTGDTVRFKIDTGAQVNVLPLSAYKRLTRPPPLKPCKDKLVGYTGQQLKLAGCIQLKGMYKGHTYQGLFHVADTPSKPVLGLQASLQLQLIKLVLSVAASPATKESVLKEYKGLFSGLGTLEGEVTLHLKKDAIPVIHPPRRVPHALKGRLKEELKKMEDSGVITKVTEPTDWVNSLVLVEKPNGKLRICLDPRDLNAAIKRPHYPMPTLEDAMSKMAGAKYFSKLDAQSGYWQLKLEEKSSLLTTFNTPFGRFKFNRLPFGINSSQDDFQRKMDEIFEGLPGVTPLVDDVIVSGKTVEEHDRNLKAALERAVSKNLRLNPEKLTIGVQEVEYFGHRITAEGLKPDPAKLRAIKDMPPPINKKELQTLLGTVTYVAKFAPNLSEITKPMRDLLKEDIEFIWDTAQQEALQKTKETILSQPVLAFFDPAKPVTLQVDASKYGLGAVLLQEGKPVAFASKSLTSTEQNYAQIEKELYAIVFGCKRFHQFLYGQKVTVQSDHKPLEIIARKPFASAPPRLQRMFLQLQKYDLDIVHVPGKDIPVADTLSRKFLQAEPGDTADAEDLLLVVHSIMKNIPVSDSKTQELRAATQNDQHMQQLKTYIQDGWPESRDECHSGVIDMWNHRDELSVIEGLIFKGEKIVVPKAMRPEMIQKIHSGHLGIEKSKQRAREILFWPGMATEIHNAVATCPICIPTKPSNTKEPLLPHTVPSRPWQKVGVDLFTLDGKQYMATVDYYSRYFEVDEMTSTTSIAVIRKLSTHFARHGIPETVMSDNGPQFVSEEFQTFATTWDFKHVTSSPGYPQSNGLAEKTVQTVKNILVKAKADGSSALLGILEYRTTPVDNLASPAQLLMGRQLRSILPATSKQLQPKTIAPQQVASRRQEMQSRQKQYYDRSAHHLPPMKTGQQVFVQLSKGDHWKPAQVTAPSSTPRSFTIQTRDGCLYRRNRRFIRPGTPPSPKPAPVPAAKPAPDPVRIDTPASSPAETITSRSGRPIRAPKRLDL